MTSPDRPRVIAHDIGDRRGPRVPPARVHRDRHRLDRGVPV